jgi:hypothetical protein
MNRTASAAPLSAFAASIGLADVPPRTWNRLNRRLSMPFSSVDAQTRDKIVRQIAFGLVVAVLFVIGGLVQIMGMCP